MGLVGNADDTRGVQIATSADRSPLVVERFNRHFSIVCFLMLCGRRLPQWNTINRVGYYDYSRRQYSNTGTCGPLRSPEWSSLVLTKSACYYGGLD